MTETHKTHELLVEANVCFVAILSPICKYGHTLDFSFGLMDERANICAPVTIRKHVVDCKGCFFPSFSRPLCVLFHGTNKKEV